MCTCVWAIGHGGIRHDTWGSCIVHYVRTFLGVFVICVVSVWCTHCACRATVLFMYTCLGASFLLVCVMSASTHTCFRATVLFMYTCLGASFLLCTYVCVMSASTRTCFRASISYICTTVHANVDTDCVRPSVLLCLWCSYSGSGVLA